MRVSERQIRGVLWLAAVALGCACLWFAADLLRDTAGRPAAWAVVTISLVVLVVLAFRRR